MTKPITTMAQTAKERTNVEAASINFTVGRFVVYGRPGYWRIIDDSIPAGEKAGGFVKDKVIKSLLNNAYKQMPSDYELRMAFLHVDNISYIVN